MSRADEEQIDHARKARRVLAQADGQTLEKASALLAEAQVHATLALVEQQRLANIIALGQVRVAPTELPPLRHLVLQPFGEHDVRPTDDIRRGLRI